MSMEQAIIDHAAALRELSASINAMNAGRADALALTTMQVMKGMSRVQKDQADAELEAAVSKVEKDAKAETKTAKTETKQPETETPVEEVGEIVALDYKKDVIPALLALNKAKGKDTLAALLKKFGAAKGDQLTPAQFADVIAEAQKQLAA